MALMTSQRKRDLAAKITSTTSQHMMDAITLGVVVDTNDPQQMGRVRAVCHRWGDSFDYDVDAIPWATYVTPFGGHTEVGTRGPALDDAKGGVAYGMWAVPKVGAQVLVMCLDSDPNQRVYIGCIFDQFTPHTMPHGRFMYDDHPNLDNNITPSGPYSSTEQPIEPLSTNMRQAFGNKDNPNFEWENRAADYSVSALDVESLSTTQSAVSDDKDITKNDWKSTQGYQTSRIDPSAQSIHTSRNLDNMVYSFTSPGFHALSMDDRIENCRVRLRTTSGHQILMDDTNERIYIATARGENWIELDQAGNIDVFTSNKLNIRAARGINFTTDDEIRMYAGKGIHMYTPGDIRAQSAGDIHIVSEQSLRVDVDNIYTQAANEIGVRSGTNINLSSGMNVNILAEANIVSTASAIHDNGPTATEATKPHALNAKWTSRIPSHEPYARSMTKHDYTHEPEFAYDDKNVNRVERGKNITRGLYWRR